MTTQYSQKQTYIKRISSVEELESYLKAKTDLNHYAFVGYIWQEHGFFPIYFNELFTEFFNDCKDSLVIGTCFAGHEIFYEGRVDELLILDGFIDTQRAYQNGQETKQFKQHLSQHQERTIAFWHTIHDFDEDRFQRIIHQFNFERELFSIGKKSIEIQQLNLGPRSANPYQYARGVSGKKYWLPENVNRWQTEGKLGWNMEHWNPLPKHPKVIQGEYSAILLTHFFTKQQTDLDSSEQVSNHFLQTLIDHFTNKKQKLVLIHDLVEYNIDDNPYIEQVRMEHYFDTQYYLSIAHHADALITPATSLADLAAYYCNTNLVLLNDHSDRASWIQALYPHTGKKCLTTQSHTQGDAKQIISFIESLGPQETSTTIRKLNIGGTDKAKGWEILNSRDADYVDHIGEASDLSRFDDKTFDVIYSSHTLEHISYWNSLIPTLSEWRRVLKDNGEILVSVPDLDVLCRLFTSKEKTKKQKFSLMRVIYGGQYHEYDYHYTGFNLDFMEYFARHAGLKVKKRVKQFDLFPDTSNIKINNELISLNVVLEKR